MYMYDISPIGLGREMVKAASALCFLFSTFLISVIIRWQSAGKYHKDLTSHTFMSFNNNLCGHFSFVQSNVIQCLSSATNSIFKKLKNSVLVTLSDMNKLNSLYFSEVLVIYMSGVEY